MIDFDIPQVQATLLEKGLNLLVAVVLIGFWVSFFILFPQMPAEVPIHSASFASGSYTYGNKTAIVLLPIIATLLAVMLFAIRFATSMLNYPVKVTRANVEVLIQLTRNLLAQMNLLILLLFLGIFIEFAFMAFEQPIPYIGFFHIGFLLYLVGILMFYVVKIIKKGKALNGKSA
ncbi:hypothetical protein ABC345_05120 [Shouchella sp. 1P09AA]|uniref:hypothetical protein n=1 Tax=unclassified Shouchella TaxID=2893065 RepID=UPI0039A36E00